jgi:hypothetical protein
MAHRYENARPGVVAERAIDLAIEPERRDPLES